MAALLTVQDVAAELKVSPRTVLQHVRSGELRALRGIGRGLGYRITREWLAEFLRAREVVARAPSIEPAPVRPARSRGAPRPFNSTPFLDARDALRQLGIEKGGRS